MPELEDIVYSDDEEDVGADADVSNLETNIHVSPIPTTRVHKDHHVNQIIGNLNLAPQTRSMTRMVKEQGGLHQINDEDFHTVCIQTRGKIAELDADEDVTLVDVDSVVEMDANTQGRMEEDVNAIKEVNATE
nr:hypothetical protein [Tanacetum cinerariifolium]